MGKRKEAMLQGLVAYFTGIPCKHGHTAKRRTVNGACTACEDGKNKEAIKEWRTNNPEKNKERRKAHVEKYKERLEASPEYRKENRGQIRLNSKKWREANKGKKNVDTAKRRAAKIQRMPKWLTEDEKERISCYYQLAAMRTRESEHSWHVDHIVPLQGKNVSGLHSPWNLKVIPAQENMNKGNRYGNQLDVAPLAGRVLE